MDVNDDFNDGFNDDSPADDVSKQADSCAALPGLASVTERLLGAAVEVFGEQGFEAARVAQIARRAGLTTGAIYARWPGKREMLIDAVGHAFDKREMLMEGDAPRSYRMLASAVSDPRKDGNQSFRAVMIEASLGARRDAIFREAVSQYFREEAAEFATVIARAKVEGLVDPELSTAALAMVFQALEFGLHLVMSAELEDSQVPTPDEWSAAVERLIADMGPPPPASAGEYQQTGTAEFEGTGEGESRQTVAAETRGRRRQSARAGR